MPLGKGYTVEGQVTGIEVRTYPMSSYEILHPLYRMSVASKSMSFRSMMYLASPSDTETQKSACTRVHNSWVFDQEQPYNYFHAVSMCESRMMYFGSNG
jgi:hypothetical protein